MFYLYRLFAVLILSTVFAFTYQTTNHFALWGPTELPFFGIEKNIPFLPWTVVIYLSTYLLILIAAFIIPKKDFKQALYCLVGIMLIHGFIFLLFPTAYPRPNFPANISGLTDFLYTFVVSIDTPQNCFPSQHVSMCTFLSLLIFLGNKKLGSIFLVWSLLIIISTLTLKQHYLLDVFGGLVVAMLMIFLLRLRHNAHNVSGVAIH